LLDPDHDRGAAFGNRHRRDGSPDSAQRIGHVRPGGRGSRRCKHPASGQDRTITLGNRQATEFIPLRGVTEKEMAGRHTTIEFVGRNPGRALDRGFGKNKVWAARTGPIIAEAQFIPFSAQTRMSGVDIGGRPIRKGAPDAIISFVSSQGGVEPAELRGIVGSISKSGGTPLVVADRRSCAWVIHLKDIVKRGYTRTVRATKKNGDKNRHDYGR